MVDARVALLYVCVHGMWIPGGSDPGPLVQPSGIDDECVVILPMANRVSVIPWVECALFPRANILRKLSPVHPDFAPEVLELKQHYNPVRHRRERKPPDFSNRVPRNSKRITIPHLRVVGARRAELCQRFILSHQLLA